MKLSQEERDALADHYKNKDIYDPSTAPEQQTADFAPEVPGMNCGGEMGYAEGGAVGDDIDLGLGNLASNFDFTGPRLSAGSDTARVPMMQAPPAPPQAPPPPQLQSLGEMPSLPPAAQQAQAVARPPLPRPSLLDAPEAPAAGAAPAAAPAVADSPIKSLKSDEYNELLKYLNPSTGQRVGRAAMSGLAGLADAIMTGVARTNGSNFQKNLAEMDESQRNAMIAALKNKYEAGFKGQELQQAGRRLAEEVRAHGAGEKNEAARLAEEKRYHDLESGQKTTALQTEANKLQVDAAHKIIEAYEKGSVLGSALGTSVRPSAAEYNQAKQVIQGSGAIGSGTVRIVDSTGKQHDLPAASLAAAKKRDPGLRVVP